VKILLIVDSEVDLAPLTRLATGAADTITLFPLTSFFTVLGRLQKELHAKSNAPVNLVDTAELINCEVTLLQDSVHHWSYALGNLKVKNKSLKDWFILPDQGGSSWWLGMLSEKNSVQDDAFFKLAQINALEKYLQQHDFDTVLIGLKAKRFAKIVKQLAAQSAQTILSLKCLNNQKLSHKQRLLNYINGMGLPGALFSAAIYWLLWLRDSRNARKKLTPLSERLAKKNSFLYVTWFPNLDADLAEQGIFRNKYAGPLQEKLSELNIPVAWLVMPVYYNGHNFASSMELAKKITVHGENLFVLQEFFTPRVFLKAFGWWLRQAWRSYRLLGQIEPATLTRGLTNVAALPILKYLWWNSFVGISGTRGIIFYLTYLEVFKQMPALKQCLYYCEMQAWEKALVMAQKKINPALKTMAFQHTVVMKNFFNYFYTPEELIQHGAVSDFPLPQQLLANGKFMHSLLARMGHPNLTMVEALRHLYITQRNFQRQQTGDKPVLLVAGSYDRVETKSLITMVYEAFPQASTFEIWFKGSPVNPMERLFTELGIDWKAANYQLLTTDIAELLPQARIALVANTTVSIEAVAFGCELIIPLFADTMMMNPVVDTDAKYYLVSNPAQLSAQVHRLLAAEPAAANNDFIDSYWNLNTALPRWTQLLSAT
jgi:surface carbohydrate biosynthesis protein (TIGR04326 family)